MQKTSGNYFTCIIFKQEGKVKKVSRSMSLKVASSVPKRVIIEAAAEKSPKKAGKVMRKDAGHTPKARRRPKRPFNERLIN